MSVSKNVFSKRKNGVVDPRSPQGMAVITEYLVSEVLTDCKNCNAEKYNDFYDLISSVYGSINVKSSKMVEKSTDNNYWSFGNNNKKVPDYYFCIGFDKTMETILHVWVIDSCSELASGASIRISNNILDTESVKRFEVDSTEYNERYQKIDISVFKEFENYNGDIKLPEADNTTISLMMSTRERLRTYAQKGTTWDKLLNDLMTEVDTLNAATSDLTRELQGKNEY